MSTAKTERDWTRVVTIGNGATRGLLEFRIDSTRDAVRVENIQYVIIPDSRFAASQV